MRRVLVIGSGRVGRTIVHMLGAEEGYEVHIADAESSRAATVAAEVTGANAFAEGVAEVEPLRRALEGMDAVISAAPFVANPQIAECAAKAGVNYFDLTEDVKVTQFVKELAEATKGVAFVPQCGVAPGPNNRLKYNLTWSTEGLVNEYRHPCESLRKGKLTMLPPLEGKEEVIVDGVTYEAFTTSGGVGTLCHTYAGTVKRLDYKTIRYPGHLELIRFLFDDLRFRDHPEELVKIFHRSIPATLDDFVLVSVRGLGKVDGRYEEKTFWRKVEGRRIGRHFFTGIELSTAAGVCGTLHAVLGGERREGMVMVEEVPYDDFMDSPFGRYYGR
ncbi:MAG: saccharopine dehydrogenase family protein, partial [Planctomycetota bacterium]